MIIRAILVIMIMACGAVSETVQLNDETLRKDLGFYYRTSRMNDLSINDRLFILFNLKDKYTGSGVNLTAVIDEIDKLEPLREKRGPEAPVVSADPISADLKYYSDLSGRVKLTVNDRLYVLFKIRDKYEGMGIDLSRIDEEIRKLNPKWIDKGKPVVYQKPREEDNKVMSMGSDINRGDIIGISVYPMEKFSGEIVVDNDGTLMLPLAGSIKAEGMSLEELETTIRAKIVKYVTDPIVTVIKHEYGRNRVVAAGEVRKPGTYQLSGSMKLHELISLAGGLTEFAEDSAYKVHRHNKTLVVNAKDFELGPGDIVEVMGAYNKVTVVGEINTPGDYNYYEGMTLSDAVKIAGGTAKAADLGKVEILRKTETSERAIYKQNLKKVLKGKEKLDAKLEPGDIILIPKK